MIQILVMGIIALAVMFSIAIHDWKLLLIIPFALIISYVNFKAIGHKLVGKAWHSIQLLILVVAMVILILTHVIKWDEILLLLALYYVTFEISLNKFRDKEFNYIGKTAAIDRFIWKICKTEAMVKQVSTLSKFFLIFAGIAIYLTGKPF